MTHCNDQLIDQLLTQAEQDCKKTGRPQQLTVARVFMQIAAQAKR